VQCVQNPDVLTTGFSTMFSTEKKLKKNNFSPK
jgi:hypothetical protein